MGRGSSQEAASILYGSDRTRQRVTVGGAVEYYDANGQLYKVRVPPASRENPEPYYQTPKQIESGDSFSAACTIHMRDGIPHRDPDQGPAVEYDGGDKLWMVDGESHREDGPATIWADGWEIWAQHGKTHRPLEDGPAMTLGNGKRFWYLHGEKIREDGS